MKALLKSFRYAFTGIKEAMSERNFRLQALVAVIVLAAAFIIGISLFEKLIIILCVAIVLCAEVFNSAIERLANFVSPSHHDQIRQIKDLMAAGVLILSLGAAIIGIAIFAKFLF
jgi:diacylglycerol kinase